MQIAKMHGVGNVSRVLKGEMPRIARAEDKSESKQGWGLIYKKRNYSKWETSPKTMARTPGTPLPGYSLTHFSLLQRTVCEGNQECTVACHDFASRLHVPHLDAGSVHTEPREGPLGSIEASDGIYGVYEGPMAYIQRWTAR